jgi:hypothetical protein
MARAALLFALLAGLLPQPALAREVVEASEPQDVSVTIYRNPFPSREYRYEEGSETNGFALITERRRVRLPRGESTIRFEGVAEGMVATSAIVTGLPGGTIERNRNADLLSPAALVDGTLGNRVTITRTIVATGEQVSERAIVRTRADGGLVLQTSSGYEAVRCSGLPETLEFDRVPDGLSARPVFSIDTRSPEGGTFEVTLTYLAWGFDWEANYVATFGEPGDDGSETLHLRSWLTLANDNGQSFENAELLVVAGALSVVSDFRSLASPPTARGLYLTCYPIGDTKQGTPFYSNRAYPPPPSPVPPPAQGSIYEDNIVVTGSRMEVANMETPLAMVSMAAVEEDLGDLKLYRVPERVTVASQSHKQIAFIDRYDVEGIIQYRDTCDPSDRSRQTIARNTQMVLFTVNDEEHGLGMALPKGEVALFEPSSAGILLVGGDSLRDHAEGQDVEISLGESNNVIMQCVLEDKMPVDRLLDASWLGMRMTLTNANPAPVNIRIALGRTADWVLAGEPDGVSTDDGDWVLERLIPANEQTIFTWRARRPEFQE